MDVDELARRAGVPAGQARAVVQALCEPSEAMIEAGMDAYLRTSRLDEDLERVVWRAMVARLLAAEEETPL